ncbi:hypothetical protein CYLTODRAFT_450049 [Cylindrobasidium torrendii FP15055 ss-10]|uniref:Zn(2)-C6 fungal-type domain-containing protein n=1 Tax=Cylindrobasidium torrendii FP15055 ss-10 TaxID=1314674 RepID=A0A0D7BRT3_9AGAR|nr:hypothetical protein CYLTODRAFT_450049 [Cylindrobasidium torrendii FP15055 ss-10]
MSASPPSESTREADAIDARFKAARACDQCRRKRRKCEPLPKQNLCKQCQSGGATCTWNLPITETRHKSRRAPEAADDSAPITQGAAKRLSTHPLLRAVGSHGSPFSTVLAPQPTFGYAVSETKLRGPTSIAHMIHSTSTFPIELMQAHNRRYRTYIDMQQHRGDAIMRIASLSLEDADDLNPLSPTAKEISSVAQQPEPVTLNPDLVERLIKFFFATHADLFPIVEKDVFITSTPLPPLLIYAMVGVSAMTIEADVPPGTLEAIQNNLALLRRSEDLFSRSTMYEIQGHLIFALSLELERGGSASCVWNHLGAAVRQAQELGLHRESVVTGHRDYGREEYRRKVWGGLVVADRWVSAMYGLPMMIDLADCDRVYPRDEGFAKLIEISILFGKVMKLIYTPTGITRVTDPEAEALYEEIQTWIANLPPELSCMDQTFAECSVRAGLLNLCYVAVQYCFVRPFMRVAYTADSLSFAITIGDWQALVVRAEFALRWCALNRVHLQGWSYSLYCMTMACIIVYHSYVRTFRPPLLEALNIANDTIKSIEHHECHTRIKIGEIVSLIWSAAVNARHDGELKTDMKSINPTRGVRLRKQKPNMRWDAERNSFVYTSTDPGLDPTEPGVPEHLVGGSVSGSTPESSSSSSGASPHPNLNPSINDMFSAHYLYEPIPEFYGFGNQGMTPQVWPDQYRPPFRFGASTEEEVEQPPQWEHGQVPLRPSLMHPQSQAVQPAHHLQPLIPHPNTSVHQRTSSTHHQQLPVHPQQSPQHQQQPVQLPSQHSVPAPHPDAFAQGSGQGLNHSNQARYLPQG